MYLGTSEKKHVSLCNCGCPFKGGLHRSVQGPLISLSMTRLLLTALKMGGCVSGGRRDGFDMVVKMFLNHTGTNM